MGMIFGTESKYSPKMTNMHLFRNIWSREIDDDLLLGLIFWRFDILNKELLHRTGHPCFTEPNVDKTWACNFCFLDDIVVSYFFDDF